MGASLFEKYGLSIAEYAATWRSFPIRVQGAGVIGSVTVSGLPQRADHELIVETLCAELGKNYSQLALATCFRLEWLGADSAAYTTPRIGWVVGRVRTGDVGGASAPRLGHDRGCIPDGRRTGIRRMDKRRARHAWCSRSRRCFRGHR